MKTRNILFFQYPWRLWRERLAGVYRYAKKAGWQVGVAEYGRNFESIAAALNFWHPDGLGRNVIWALRTQAKRVR